MKMPDYNNEHTDRLGCILCLAGWVVVVLLAMILTGCSPKVVQPHPAEQKHDTLIVMDRQRDSIIVHDSIYIREVLKGDTVRVEQYIYKNIYHDRLLYDTTYICRTDTIVRVQTIEKKLTQWQTTKMVFGQIAIWGALLLVIYLVISHKRQK